MIPTGVSDANEEVEVIVKPLVVDDYSGLLAADVYFDVVFHWREISSFESSSRFHHIERSLLNFTQLEKQLDQEIVVTGCVSDRQLPLITSKIMHFYQRAKKNSHSKTNQHKERDAARLAWILESYLTELLAIPEVVTASLALKQFIHSTIIADHISVGDQYRRAIQETLVMVNTSLNDERVGAGCTFEETTIVPSALGNIDSEEPDSELDARHLVLWRFKSQRSNLVFSAHFLPHSSDGMADGKGEDRMENDPYGVDAYIVAWSTGVGAKLCTQKEETDADPLSLSRYAAHFRTRYHFPDESTSTDFVYGHFLAKTPGKVTFMWENADTSSVVSKELQFQVAVVPLSRHPEPPCAAAVAGQSILDAVDEITASNNHLWLHEMIQNTSFTALDQSPGYVDEEEFDEYRDSDIGEAPGYDSESTLAKERTERLLAEKHFHAQRAIQLQDKVFHLEETLERVKTQLTETQQKLDISEEIYKASLETITQLEQAGYGQRRQLAHAAFEPEQCKQPTVSTKEASPMSNIDEKEHRRLVNICTKFQEQCLWQSIEAAENQKRTFVLESQLALAEQTKLQLEERLTYQDQQLKETHQQNQRLKAQKAILVKEVKKLQPFSQVNIAALIQEAQEARMMQRILQAKLDTRSNLPNLSEVATITSSACIEAGLTSDFVIVESNDHSTSALEST